MIQYRADEQFEPRIEIGPGKVLFPSVVDGLSPERKIKGWLLMAVEWLKELKPESIEEKSLEILPPIMATIAEALPERVSASGDLVIIGPDGPRWSLF
jgi:hypothetical protein